MLPPAGQSILDHLEAVAHERARQSDDPARAARVQALKAWQQQRFVATYADLLADPRYAAAARFFLDDLYGPGDFSARDKQFARIVPTLQRLFPADLVATVAALAELHALSERLDTAMAYALPDSCAIDDAAYRAAWRTVGEPASRERQIALLMKVGRSLDRYVRNPLLRQSLKLMRAPASAAGLGALQTFLERGFDTFRSMRGVDDFLSIVERRERELVDRLFDEAPT